MPVRLGIDSFSVRWQGWDAFRIIDYAAELGLDNVHFSERAHLGGLEPAHLERVRDYAGERGLTLEIGMRSFNRLSTTFDPALGTGEAQLREMIDAAVIVGSPIVRCFVGMQSDRAGGHPVPALIAETVRTLRAAAPYAEKAGVAIAVENHGMGDLLVAELRDVIEAVDSPCVRVCLDTGNPLYAAEGAVYAAEVLAPYTVSCHLLDTRVWLAEDGAMVQWAPVGRGNVDVARIVSILQDAAPDAPIDLEIITGGGPKLIPIYDPGADFWAIYPEQKASVLTRFLAVARRGEAGPLDQLELSPGAPAPSDALKRQQLDHFEESVRYCRDVLGLHPVRA